MTATQQHRLEVWASNLLFLTFAVSLMADYRLGCGYFAAHKSQADYGMLYLGNSGSGMRAAASEPAGARGNVRFSWKTRNSTCTKARLPG